MSSATSGSRAATSAGAPAYNFQRFTIEPSPHRYTPFSLRLNATPAVHVSAMGPIPEAPATSPRPEVEEVSHV